MAIEDAREAEGVTRRVCLPQTAKSPRQARAFQDVADPRGFEPLTARFVAEYSIQLSYGSDTVVLDQITTGGITPIDKRPASSCMADPRGFEPLTARFVAEYSIQLSYGSRSVVLDQITTGNNDAGLTGRPASLYGGPKRIRTSDRSVRSRVLYPAELWVRVLPRIIGRFTFLAITFSLYINDLSVYPFEAPYTNNGGEGGIRTPDTLMRYTPLAGERLRPLGHLTATRGV